jgi:hypothetical protein
MLISLSNKKCYKLDIDALIKYCDLEQDDKTVQKDMTELYKEGISGIELTQKQITETRVQLKPTDGAKYGIVKTLIEVLGNMGIHQGETGSIKKSVDIESGTVSVIETIAWNTLISIGIIVEIKI